MKIALLKNHSHLLTIILFVLIAPAELNAQKYVHSAGIRAGFSSGISYKWFFDRQEAIGFDALYNRNGFMVSASFQYQIEPFRKDRYMFYFGGGPFGGNWDDAYSIGIFGIAGFEYALRDLPLVFSVDWRPLYNIIKHSDFEGIDFGLSIRYYFEKRLF